MLSYGSESDFIREGTVVGLKTYVSKTVIITNLKTGDVMNRIEDELTYDERAQLTLLESTSLNEGEQSKSEASEYIAWDSSQRPVMGTYSRKEEDQLCSNVPITIVYDDTNRTSSMTFDYLSDQVENDVDNDSCGRDEANTVMTIYDEDNFATSYSEDGGQTFDFSTTEVTATDEVCE